MTDLRFSRTPRTLAALASLLCLCLCSGSVAFAKDASSGGTLAAEWRPSETSESSVPVTFSFHRQEFGEGRLSVQLGEQGPNYVGNYLLLTGKWSTSRLRTFYTHWVNDDFDAFRVGPVGAPLNRRQITIEQFQRRYTGSVVATLIGSQGGAIRCVFTLRDASAGLPGGASGSCQTSDGGVVDLVDEGRR